MCVRARWLARHDDEFHYIHMCISPTNNNFLIIKIRLIMHLNYYSVINFVCP